MWSAHNKQGSQLINDAVIGKVQTVDIRRNCYLTKYLQAIEFNAYNYIDETVIDASYIA